MRPSAQLEAWLANEKLRFLLAGAWNSLFGWATFAALWGLLGGVLNLWAISAIAHLAATTQAFFVQRRLVFRNDARDVWHQYLKFQLSYLALLGIGALLVNALAAQGVHPLASQLLGIVLLAVCGFVFGKNFTFAPTTLSAGAAWRRIHAALGRHALALVLFAASMAAFEFFWGSVFYSESRTIGHDFTLTGTGLLEGKYWIDSNGLLAGLFNPPWFTAAWCAGTAYYADPQSLFYSPLQMLALLVNPVRAVHLNALLFAAMAFWSSYVLARRVLCWSSAPAVLFAVLGIANAFLPLRSALGQAGYQHLYLWPVLVSALCWPAADRPAFAIPWPSIVVALCLTAWLQFGFGGMMIPACLASLLLCLVLVLLGHARLPEIIQRGALGSVVALALNASRVYENLSLMRQFPRDFYAPFGFHSFLHVLEVIPLSLVLPSSLFSFLGGHAARRTAVDLLPTEWSMNFGVGALLMALLAAALLLWRNRRSTTSASARSLRRFGWALLVATAGFFLVALSSAVENLFWSGFYAVAQPQPGTPWATALQLLASGSPWPALCMTLALGVGAWSGRAALRQAAASVRARIAGHPFSPALVATALLAVFIAAIPALLLYADGYAGQLVKKIPILNTTTWTMRWIVIYLPVVQLLLAAPVAALLRNARGRTAPLVALAGSVLIWAGPATEPIGYYLDPQIQSYDPRPVIRAFERSRNDPPPRIHSINAHWYGIFTNIRRNDSMLAGASQALCYNPLYGYLLESFPQLGRLQHGPALSLDGTGRTMLLNPACLVHPAENACEPGDGFDFSDPRQRAQAELLLERKPYAWNRPPLAHALSLLSQFCFWTLLTLVLMRGWQGLLHLARPQERRHPAADTTAKQDK